MMTFAFFLLGGLAGIFAWFYLDRFIPNLQQEIYQNYVELYPENRPIFHSEKALIQSQKCGHIFRYFLGFGLCFAVLDYFLQDELKILDVRRIAPGKIKIGKVLVKSVDNASLAN